MTSEPIVAAVDMETYYDADYSLSEMNPHAYVHDPRFDPYLVSVVFASGEEYVGSPLRFDWSRLAGAILVMHNAAFDDIVIQRLVELGQIPAFEHTLRDTADMAAFLRVPRSLAKACEPLLGVVVNKAPRAAMKGRHWNDLTPEEQLGMCEYALDDSRLCLQLYQKHGHRMPDWEWTISQMNREATWRGIRVDPGAITEGLKILEAKREAAIELLPWTGKVRHVTKKGKEQVYSALSPGEFLAHCEKLGLPILKSLDRKDPLMIQWVKKYAPLHPFIQARLDVASLNPHINRCRGMLERTDKEGIFRFESKFYGCHTGRGAGKGREGEEGGAKVNIRNIPKGDKKGLTHGVDLRGMFLPRNGKCFFVLDFSQIEARVVQWLAGNKAFLALVEKENIYQASAKMMGWFPQDGAGLKEKDAKLYALAKASTLGLGFSLGAAKFVLFAERSGAKLDSMPRDQWVLDRRAKFVLRNVAFLDWNNPVNDDAIGSFFTADAIVRQWRAANPQVVRLWAKLQEALIDSARQNRPCHTFTLPSGRVKPYWKPHVSQRPKKVYDAETGEVTTTIDNRLVASLEYGAPPEILHGGLITENLVQAIARDIMFFGALAVEREAPQWKYVLDCYDELVWEIDLCDIDAATKVIPELLCTDKSLSWAKGLPLGVEGGPADKYTKWDPRWKVWPPEGGWKK